MKTLDKIVSKVEELIAVVRQAGEIVNSAKQIDRHTHEKTSAADLVTDYDLAVEQFLKEQLAALMPEALFFGEEEKAIEGDPSKGWVFIVDPIDGTTNFVRGYHQSGISVSLIRDLEPQMAVVYDPAKDELFAAERGKGATLNGTPIHVSDKPLDQGLFIMGTAIYLREFVKPTMSLTEQLLERSCDYRRFGAATLDLCYIACGRAEVFFEYSLAPWDYAAGAFIAQEAGAIASTLTGEPLPWIRRCSVWLANPANQHVLGELTI